MQRLEACRFTKPCPLAFLSGSLVRMAAALLNASVPSCGAPAPYYACAAALQNARPVSRFSDREAKKAAKAARVARAGAPGHLAKKAALIESINKGRPARDVVEAEKKEAVRQLKDALRERMRREMLSEVDTDGEEK